MKKVWLMSDLHMGHKLMTKLEQNPRPEGYEFMLLDAARACVGEGDTLYILGDIAFAQQGFWVEKIGALPGAKVLVKGNHDQNRDNWYLNKGFDMVIPFGKPHLIDWYAGPDLEGNDRFMKVMLSHIPADAKVLSTYDDRFVRIAKRHYHEMREAKAFLNIHGHTHGQGAETATTFDVTPEVVGYAPVTLDQIIRRKFLED